MTLTTYGFDSSLSPFLAMLHALQRTITHCNILQHTATHCNTATHRNAFSYFVRAIL